MDDEQAAHARSVARQVLERGLPMATVRRWANEDPFWGLVRDEVGFIRARCRWRVIDGGASRHPLAVRIAAAGK